MYINVYLKDNTTLEVVVPKYLKCIGNEKEAKMGFYDFCVGLGFDMANIELLTGFTIHELGGMILTNSDLKGETTISITINSVDFNAIKDEVFKGIPFNTGYKIPLNYNKLKTILNDIQGA